MSDRTGVPEIDIVFTMNVLHQRGQLGKLLTLVGELGGLIGDISTDQIGKTHSHRHITISVFDYDHLREIQKALSELDFAELLEVQDLVFEKHKGGKMHYGRREDVRTVQDLRYIYTPGVARVCEAIAESESCAREYTAIPNTVGIFTNGTRVLGLGDIGPVASLPVMEGKAVIYDQFVGLGAVPILVDTKDPEEFVRTVERVAPSFGGVHLEDIRVPDCFYIEDELKKRLDKPVMHDDQHGTGTVVLAAVMSACRWSGLEPGESVTAAQVGLGAAGFGIASLLLEWGAKVYGVDPSPEAQARFRSFGGETAELEKALAKARIVITTTGRVGLIRPDMVREGQIILALSNPVPEIEPAAALAAGAAFAADGKSINNALAYPGLFRAALEFGAKSIDGKMKIAAAEAISALAEEGELVPGPFDPSVHRDVIAAVERALLPG